VKIQIFGEGQRFDRGFQSVLRDLRQKLAKSTKLVRLTFFIYSRALVICSIVIVPF